MAPVLILNGWQLSMHKLNNRINKQKNNKKKYDKI